MNFWDTKGSTKRDTHKRIHYSKNIYAVGDVHMQTIDG